MPWIRPHCTLWQYTPEVMRKAISDECFAITQQERKAAGLPEQAPVQGYDPRPNPRPPPRAGGKKGGRSAAGGGGKARAGAKRR